MNINSNNFILKPKNDYVFKKIFGDERNKDILIAFLKAVLKIDIEDVQILNSELSKLFDLSNVNWEYIWEQSQKSKCIECWKLWNSGIHNVTEISRILNISRPTVITYLKRGTECGKCEYYINRRK